MDGGLKQTVEREGFAIVEGVVDSGVVDGVLQSLGTTGLAGRAGTRQLHLRVPGVAEFLRGGAFRRWMDELLPGGFPVRTILFDKTAETNWRVPWHQDLSIPVRERHPVLGFGPWSVKEGVTHAQPPTDLLERMLTVRLHLDDCGEMNGALEVIPGSHRGGRLSAGQIAEWRARERAVTCAVSRGGVVVMKPLLLHRSSPASAPTRRRVLHVELAAEALPPPLEWG